MRIEKIEEYAEKAQMNKKELLLFIWNSIVFMHLAILIIRYIYGWFMLQKYIISNNPIYLILAIVAPFIIWVYSTTTDYWNFHNRKVFTSVVVASNAIFTVLQPIHTLFWRLIVPRIFTIEPNEVLTQSMILMLGRVAMLIPSIVIGIILGINIYAPILSEGGRQKIAQFKLKNYVDTRKNKENIYDMNVVKNLQTGKDVTVHENDRFTHTLVNGVSGTGKTSSTMVVSIYNDLCKKVNNRNKRQRALAQMVIDNKAEVRRPLPKDPFDDPIIVPRKKYKQEYLDIIETYPDCGITVMAPNCGLTDDVVKLCEAMCITPAVIDPMPDETTHKAKKYLTGMNPFYISSNLDPIEKAAQIYEKATAFADTMQAIYDTSGTQDAYFAGINSAVSTNICVVCMLGVPLCDGRVCNINDIQKCMNNFNELEPYIAKIEDTYFNKTKIVPPTLKTDQRGGQKIEIGASEKAAKTYTDPLTGIETPLTENAYYQTIYFVKQELLGEGAVKMFDQARGLRNMINNFLANPRVKQLLTMDKFIDYDAYLRRGKITVVNTALEISSSTSTAFGSFFMLNFKQAVFRRPKKPRINHFWYIDEFPVYLNKETEAMFTLFRQYRVGMCVAIQTLDQFNKTAATKYLQGTVMGCSTHIVFGRLSPTDMKMYQDKAGMIEYDMEQVTQAHNASVLTPDEKATESVRVTKQRKNLMEGHDMSARDFQEVTIFTVREGKIEDPVFGKVAFLNPRAFKKKPLQTVMWKNLMTEDDEGIRRFKPADTKVAPTRQDAVQILKENAIGETESIKEGVSDIVESKEALLEYLEKNQNTDIKEDSITPDFMSEEQKKASEKFEKRLKNVNETKNRLDDVEDW